MAKFLTVNELNTEIGKILETAKEKLILISPYIKLHHRFANELKIKGKNDALQIIVVFGKNEHDLSQSMTSEDLAFFKKFRNIEIRYEPRLHAKFYANESTQIVTSMNLYDFSQNENIEAGIITNYRSLGNLASKVMTGEKSMGQEAWEFFSKVIDQSKLLFKNVPLYRSTMLGLGKKFDDIKTTEDITSEFFAKRVLNMKTRGAVSTSAATELKYGYCIRTGEKIPFNPQKPYSINAFKSWARHKDPNFQENYCHKTGIPSDGKTSLAHPIL